MPPILVGKMVYIGCQLKALIGRKANPELVGPLCADPDLEWHYLSLLSLSQNKECRAALIDAIFFSKDHDLLRHRLVGPKFSLTENLLLCPNGPNVKPDVPDRHEDF